MELPFLDLTRQYRALSSQIDPAIARVVESGRYIGGDEVTRLEEELARYCGVRFGVSMASGTDALLACLMAMDISEGDEVITTPFTFIATAEVVSILKARPVFVDIEPDTFNIDPARLESKITGRTKCIIPVHIFGHMANMERIGEIAGRHGIGVLEDAAQAVGASIGGKRACGFGEAGALSFFPSKNLGAFGDGGMILTNREKIAKKAAVIKDHGSEKRYHHSVVGFNGRLDAIQAAVLRVKLKHLESWNEKRRANASYYSSVLQEYVSVPVEREGYRHVYHQYSVLTDRREKLCGFLRERGIPTAVYYPVPLHLQEVFKDLGYAEGDFPVTEEVSKKVVSLPCFPEITDKELTAVARAVIEFFENEE
jgi:dTDP-4-amino-4,6-dideoxygalactose transaminase